MKIPEPLNIVFLDAFTINPGDLPLDALKQFGTLKCYNRTTPEDVIERSKDADVLIVNKVVLGEKQFASLPRLRLVCEAATGFDKIDINAARKHHVTVCNCAGYSSRSVAQLVLSLVLDVADSVSEYAWRNKQGDWCRSEHFCYTVRPRIELVDKRMAIVGFGNIGRAVADVFRPLGVKLYAVTSKAPENLPSDVEKISLEDAFSSCDIVSLNCPLTETNREFVNSSLLANTNPNLILVNTARGGLINENDVAKALREEKLKAYCTDVLNVEPPLPGNPILSAPRTVVTPHIGWDTPEARGRILDIICENIQSYIKGKPQNVVNP